MTTLIVLDTTETFGNPRLEGPDFAFLRSYVSRHPVALVIPQIVVEETVNHYREQLEAAVAQASSSLRAIGRLTPHLVEKIEIICDLDKEVTSYRDGLVKQLDSFQIKRPAYESVKMSSLVSRALARRKPFDARGGAGFRDALIWESILAYIESEKPADVVIVTRNKRDFGEHGALADDLAGDLAFHGISREAVTVCEGLQRFITERVKPSLQTLDEIERKLNEGEFEGLDLMQFFEEWGDGIRDELAKHVRKLDLSRLSSRYTFHYHRASLGRGAELPDEFKVADVWRVGATELAIGVDFCLPGSISCLRQTSRGPYEEPWDEDFQGKAVFTLFMTVMFNEQSKEVESWELHEIKVELTRDW